MSEARNLFSLAALDSFPKGEAAEDPQPSPLGKVARRPEEVKVSDLSRRVDSLAALVMAQNAVLERVAGILEAQTVNRTQERAIKAATAKRALELCRREGLKGRWVDDAFGKYWYNPERHMAEAIRKTLRELTGVRAAADIPARMYDAAMNHINTWDYPGAIRRVRRRLNREL
jgi:hypothetical protein